MGFGWKPYVSVAKRRAQAVGKMNTLKKKGLDIQPIEIAGRKIAHTFWGQSWCSHLEAFSDYANRLPRGRTYVRNGSVCHLLISSGEIKAIVSGSELYDVKIKIDMLPPSKWSSVKERCSGQIGSLLELLQGRLSNSVMAVVTHRIDGLFPAPSEIRLDCSCPDWATMCKHVAAVLYGVGARLDERPELLFLLRGVDHEELISADAAAALTSTDSAKQQGRRRIATSELEDLFGIEIQEEAEVSGLKGKPKTTATKPAIQSAPKIVTKSKPAVASSPDRPPTAKAVRDLRASLELTPANLAALVGVTAATVNNWEKKRGPLNLQPRTMKSLAAAMKLTKQQAHKQLQNQPEASSDYIAVVNPQKLKKTQNKGNAAMAKTSNLPKIADPNIQTILAQFLDESAVSLKGSAAKREDAIDWFTDCLNNYGHQGLSPEETALFDRYYDLEGDSHKEFCQVFGPDKIIGSVSEFVGYYLIRKVMGSPTSLGVAA
ncbi:SWIM zinc finger family protein [bacterium]|nr:SWIM zinc finger family protein [bacterium]MBP9811424.1 SWIM zinc finger family protein [bacterium]